MNPIIISDFYQSKRAAFKVLGFLGVVFSAVHYFFGYSGSVVCMALLLPSISNTIGLGTVGEEYTKGQFRFIYTMPIRRSRIWLVKLCYGIFGIALLWSMALLIVRFCPSRKGGADFLSNLPISVGYLMIASFVGCLYSYFAGLFCMGIFFSVMGASIAGVIAAYLPLIAFWLMYVFFGIIPRWRDLVMVFSVTSLALLFGSWVLFSIRNPYLEQRWRCRFVGLFFGIISLGIFCLSVTASSYWRGQPEHDYTRGVIRSVPSPNGELVCVTGKENPVRNYSYVLDRDGRLVADIGGGFDIFQDNLTWRPGKEGKSVLCVEIGLKEMINASRWEDRAIYIYDLDSGKKQMLKNPNIGRRRYRYLYSRWSEDGEYLLGVRNTMSKYNVVGRCVFRQEVATGLLDEISVTDDPSCKWESPVFLSSNLVLLKDSNDEGDTKTFSIANLDSQKITTHKVPVDAIQWQVVGKGSTLVAVRKFFGEVSVEYEILSQDLATGEERVIIGRDELPKAGFEEIARGKEVSLSFSFSPDEKWICCSLEVGYGRMSTGSLEESRKMLLIDYSSGAQFVLAEYNSRESYDRVKYSQDEKLVYLVLSSPYGKEAERGWHEKVEIFDTRQGACTKLHSIEFQERYSLGVWGNDRLLYMKTDGNTSLGSNTNELWVLNCTNGSSRRLYSGEALSE